MSYISGTPPTPTFAIDKRVRVYGNGRGKEGKPRCQEGHVKRRSSKWRLSKKFLVWSEGVGSEVVLLDIILVPSL